jgi:hypothetical protein
MIGAAMLRCDDMGRVERAEQLQAIDGKTYRIVMGGGEEGVNATYVSPSYLILGK